MPGVQFISGLQLFWTHMRLSRNCSTECIYIIESGEHFKQICVANNVTENKTVHSKLLPLS